MPKLRRSRCVYRVRKAEITCYTKCVPIKEYQFITQEKSKGTQETASVTEELKLHECTS